MAKKKKCPDCPPVGAPAYMNTYGDMMTLLVTFFVLLISYSTMEVKKFNQAMTSLRGALGVLTQTQGVTLPIANMPLFQIGRSQQEQQLEIQIQKVKEVVEEVIEEMKKDTANQGLDLEDMMQVNQSKDQIHFNISEPMLFRSGSADLNRTAYPLLEAIANILNIVPFEIRVEGHTDNVPMRGSGYPRDNWELSYARAMAITRRFVENGVTSSRFQVIGYGEFRPIADNGTEEGRSLNRRVDIYLNLRDEVKRSLLPGE